MRKLQADERTLFGKSDLSNFLEAWSRKGVRCGAVNDLSLPAFQHAIKALHGAHSHFVRRVRVAHDFEDLRVWDGEVLVFALIDHPRSDECFVWELDGEVTAILHDDAIKTAQDAVREAIEILHLDGPAVAERRR